MTNRLKVANGIIIISLVFGGYCYHRYRQEQRWLAVKAREIVDQAGAHTRREKIMALRDYIRLNVRYEGLSQDGRPFLRNTAWETLQSGRGYCGEATRALVNLTAQFGIRAHRVNLHGPVNHVVAEVEVSPGNFRLVDPQDNSGTNPYLDERDRALDEVVGCSGSLFVDYSNLNLRRVPLVSGVVQRVRVRAGLLTWTLENPWLILADLGVGIPLLGFLALGFDRLLLRLYAYRLGVRLRPLNHQHAVQGLRDKKLAPVPLHSPSQV